MKFILTLLLCFSFSAQSWARPVSYPTGWTLMLTNNKDFNASHIHYSPSTKYSVGWRHEYRRDEALHIDSVQLNNLLKRWNGEGSQANLYLKSALGVAHKDGSANAAAFTGLATDWETRRYFASYENRVFWVDAGQEFIQNKARIGIAPYIGDYGDLHTWLMLETEYKIGDDHGFSVTPLVRFFKRNSLVEAGYNFDGALEVNFIQRF